MFTCVEAAICICVVVHVLECVVACRLMHVYVCTSACLRVCVCPCVMIVYIIGARMSVSLCVFTCVHVSARMRCLPHRLPVVSILAVLPVRAIVARVKENEKNVE